jgi:multidrug efflux pump subunit AcrB
MHAFNLSDWALRHRSLVWYFILVSLVAGAVSYLAMGREEDPAFTIKTMIIQASLPGATAEETVTQVTDRIEKKLQELDSLDFTKSVTYPGRAIVYVNLLPSSDAADIKGIWQRVRNMMTDIRGEFPAEFGGMTFNDSFGDVFGNIYAFTSDGFTPRELRDRVEDARTKILGLELSGKVDLIGERDEVVFLEFSTRRLAALGFDRQVVIDTLSAQNAIVPSGVIETGDERILVRVPGQFEDAQSIADVNLRIDDKFFNLADLGEVRRGYRDPPANLFRYNGQDAIGLVIGMREGGNILDFGEALDAAMTEVRATLPIGIEMYRVADQPHVVEEAVGHFTQSFVEAVAIVLAVSFVSLGLRAGLVVTMTIPLVLAMTFVVLELYGITLQRISLGALIIALGLLVDDAMIAIETMISRMEIGETREKAASYAWKSIAFPMLSGTAVTVAGFIPIGLNDSNAGEFTFSLFVVIAVSLALSWVVAVLFAPILGVTFLPKVMKHAHAGPGRLRRIFHRLLRAAMRARWLTIAMTVAMFATSLWGMKFVEQQFFPLSDRTELIIDINARQNASFMATDTAIAKVETFLATREEVSFWSAYVGTGAPRFVLSFDTPTPGAHMGQIVVQTPSIAARDSLKPALEALGRDTLYGVDVLVKYLEVGPPVGKPVQYRISGPDIAVLRDAGRDLAALLAQEPRLRDVTLDWNEPARVVRLDLDQDKARRLGLTSRDIAGALNAIFDGSRVTQLRDDEYLVDLIARGQDRDRGDLSALENLQIPAPSGAAIPLRSFASLSWGTEQPLIMLRNRVPTITVKAAINGTDQPATLDIAMGPQIDAFRAALPPGYGVEAGGAVESSADSQAPIAAVAPVMIMIMLTLIMIQMQGFRLTFIVLAAAPLGLIGVVAALVSSGAPLGFVAILGVLALIGILIRNSIILVHEIEVLFAEGRSRWDAVFEASDSRARPILLTAAAASLALIPISRQIFWGPMAYAMMGGIIAGTLITLVFVPALYCAVFGVERPARGA